jgi:very-short-patch-repair endonuclease
MRGPNAKSTRRARSLRRQVTHAESVLWLQLRDRRLGGFKFARQQPIGPYYVDFVCRDRRLIVEVDGGQHADNPTDRQRDAYLELLRYRVVRIWNNEVLGSLRECFRCCYPDSNRPLTLSLSPRSGERERG